VLPLTHPLQLFNEVRILESIGSAGSVGSLDSPVLDSPVVIIPTSRKGFQPGNKFAAGLQNTHNPRKKLLTQELVSQLHEFTRDARGKLTSKTKLGKIVERLIDNAIAGETDAIKEIFTRIEGKPIQPLSLGAGDDGGDFEFSVSIGRTFADGTTEASQIKLSKTAPLLEAGESDL